MAAAARGVSSHNAGPEVKMTTVSENVCVVCGEAGSPDLFAVCNACGQTFHYRQREDGDGKDCGKAWIDPEFMTLDFACDTCLAPATPAALDEVITADEAAERIGLTEDAVIAMAESGQLVHRKAGGSVYLFQASDIDALRDGTNTH
jgi:hypothetical protein